MKLINDDCQTVMAQYPDKYFDLAIVDPPYGIGDFNIKTRLDKNGNRIKANSLKVEWNDNIPSSKYFNELYRISKNQIIWGANYYNCFKNGGALIWHKGKRQDLFSQCEIASLSFQKKVDYVLIQWQSGFVRKSYEKTYKAIHPCQKPIQLYKWLLTNYAKPDYKIIDTHLGSGSHAIAWHYFQKGGEFVGIEIDKEYFDAAKKRIEKNTLQLEMI